ncbi:MAG: 3-deoxy-manno-octulosonate cytidylyltransferase [Alphaproteobacteria bacterium]
MPAARQNKSDVPMASSVIVIPARLAATRLPGKPMALIGDVPMVVQVMRRAMEAEIAPVVVACDAEEIADAVRAHGGRAILTRSDHPSGSDRVWEAVLALESGFGGDKIVRSPKGGGMPPSSVHFDIIINLQGDLPTLDPALIRSLLTTISRPGVDIATLAAPITRSEEHTNPAVVKAVIAADGRALYFTRATAPYGDGPRYHHIGIYAYRREALARFVSLPPSPLEKREKLEQLRALEDGLHMAVAVVDTVPLGVDTPEDLARARMIMKREGQ